MEYVPGSYDGAHLENYVRQELEALADIIKVLVDGELTVRTQAPSRPRNGIYYADGTDWDPGSGRGVYRYDESTETYIKLG